MMQGFQRAIVRNNNDPDKLGRVRVEYPWFQGDSLEHPSEWCEVCTPFASKEAGMWFIPEIGEEVLVYLQGGNLDHPVILGSLYSKQNRPPESNRAGDHNSDNSNALKFIRTRSGHLLAFDDSDADRAVVLKDKEGRRLEILSKENKIVLSDEQNNCLVIEGPTITISNSNGDEVRIESGGITVKSQSVKIEAAASLELGAGATEALVKGQSFMSLFNSHTHTTAWGPSGPPMAPMTPAQLSAKVKTV